jgi:hypothetical protein
MDRDKMSNLYRGPSIDASYQASVHLAEGFQRRRLKCEKLTVDIRRTPSDGKSSHCLWQGELKTKTNMYLSLTLHFTDLTSFLTLASQNAPLYLALTSVPTDKYGGSSPVYND